MQHIHKMNQKNRIAQMMKSRTSNYEKLKARLEKLYEDVQITPMQKSECDRLRLEYATKSRQMLEDYMAKEILVLEDLAGKFQYTVGSYVDAEKEKLSLK